MQEEVANSAPFVIDSAEDTPLAISAEAGLPSRVRLSELLDPWIIVRDAIPAPTLMDGKEAMDREMASLKSRDVYELVPCVGSLRALNLHWVQHLGFKNGVFI